MKKLQQRNESDQDDTEGDVKKVLHELLDHSRDPSRMLEVYYWSTEPELADFVRQFLRLSEPARHSLMAFLSMTKEAGDSVAVTIGLKGELTLSSPAVSDAMQMKTANSIPSGPSDSVH